MRVPKSPWLSVVLPTYQGARYLEAAMESIEREADGDLEIVAIDDGSTDTTPAILERWRERLPLRITLGSHSGNWVRSTNQGICQARGEWISILHQDDGWRPGRLARLRAAAAASETEFILHAAQFIDADGTPQGHWRCPLPANRPVSPAIVLPRLLVQNFIPIPAPAIHRSRIARTGPMDENLWYFADWDYWLRLAALGPLWYLPESLATFRLHAESQTAQRTHDHAAITRQFDRVTNRALALAPLPRSAQRRARQTVRLARAVYRFLLCLAHHERPDWRELLGTIARTSPVTWVHYLRSARLADRVLPRLRLRRQQREHTT